VTPASTSPVRREIGEASAADAAPVLTNNVIVGSVNANRRRWHSANEKLAGLDRKWLSRLITRYEKPAKFQQVLERMPDDIKVVIQFSEI